MVSSTATKKRPKKRRRKPRAVRSRRSSAEPPKVHPDYYGWARRAMRPKVVRTMLQFAEKELVLPPNGPRAGLMFRAEYAPFTRLMLEEMDNPRWKRFVVTGSAQSGKTLLGFVLPALYHLFEMEETVICLVPNMILAEGIWKEKLEPVFQETQFSNMKPTAGRGSRGGKFEFIKFRNGTVLRFIAAGAADEQRSSHTARVGIATELDKMDKPGASSREASPIRQLHARTFSFGDRERIFGECTLSTKHGATWKTIFTVGTGTEIYIPCPHCGKFILPKRESLVGWQEAEDVLTARENAGYACQECGAIWSEEDRRAAIRYPVLVHKGQRIIERREAKSEKRKAKETAKAEVDRRFEVEGRRYAVVGAVPRTETFGLRWTAFHFPTWTLAKIAAMEFEARMADDPDDAELELCQFVWALPYEPEGMTDSVLTANYVRDKTNGYDRGVIPATAEKVTLGIDIGKRACHWTLLAWQKDATGYVADYGVIEVPEGQLSPEKALLSALRDFRDEVIAAGWEDSNGTHREADLIGLDARYETGAIYEFCRESGPVRFKPIMGFGTGRGQGHYRHPTKHTNERVPGNNWFLALQQAEGQYLVCAHSDYWKHWLHQRLLAPVSSPGALTLFRPERRLTHLSVSKHLTAEIEVEEFNAKGRVVRWNCISRNNHWLDASMMGCLLADMAGVKLIAAPKQEPRPRGRRKPEKQWLGKTRGWI